MAKDRYLAESRGNRSAGVAAARVLSSASRRLYKTFVFLVRVTVKVYYNMVYSIKIIVGI